MTTLENNPYYYGNGVYNGLNCQLYYDYHKKIWSAQSTVTGVWFEDINEVDIED